MIDTLKLLNISVANFSEYEIIAHLVDNSEIETIKLPIVKLKTNIMHVHKNPINVKVYNYYGNLSNGNKPAVIKFNYKGEVILKYYKNGFLHRINGPAFVLYVNFTKKLIGSVYVNGRYVMHKDWYINGKRHSSTGLSEITYDFNGTVNRFFDINGKFFTEERFFNNYNSLIKLLENN